MNSFARALDRLESFSAPAVRRV